MKKQLNQFSLQYFIRKMSFQWLKKLRKTTKRHWREATLTLPFFNSAFKITVQASGHKGVQWTLKERFLENSIQMSPTVTMILRSSLEL